MVQSKVLGSPHREEIIAMMRSNWSLRGIRKWLLDRGESISTMTLSRFRENHIPISEMIPKSYFETYCKDLDVLIDALTEHAKAIYVQKQRCSVIFQQEAANNVIFAEGRKEMALLSQMLLTHKRMEEGLRPLVNVQNQVGQVIEVKWLDNTTYNTIQPASAPAGVPSEQRKVQDTGVRKTLGENDSSL